MKPIAVLDSCVLYPYHLRDFLIHLFVSGELYRPRWSDDIHIEWTRNLKKNRPELDEEALKRTVYLMNRLPETGIRKDKYESLISECHLPDPNDNHVFAAAISCQATYIVTFNLKDFPNTLLSKKGITSIHPDEFVSLFMDASRDKIIQSLQQQVLSLKNPPMTMAQLKETLHNLGLKLSMKNL